MVNTLLYSQKGDMVSMVQEDGWSQKQVWTEAGNMPPPPLEFDPWAIQCMESHYTNFAIPAH